MLRHDAQVYHLQPKLRSMGDPSPGGGCVDTSCTGRSSVSRADSRGHRREGYARDLACSRLQSGGEWSRLGTEYPSAVFPAYLLIANATMTSSCTHFFSSCRNSLFRPINLFLFALPSGRKRYLGAQKQAFSRSRQDLSPKGDNKPIITIYILAHITGRVNLFCQKIPIHSFSVTFRFFPVGLQRCFKDRSPACADHSAML